MHARTLRFPLALSLLALASLVGALPLGAQQPGVPDLARRSSLIFTATVEKPDTVTAGVPAVGGDVDAVAARVDRVLDAPPAIGILPQQRLTIRGSGLAAGDQRIFFAQPYWIGATLAVDVVGALPATPAAAVDAVAQQVAKTRQADADAALLGRLKSAALIVAGRVVRPPHRLPPSGVASEHNPDWWSAAVEAIPLQGGAAKQVVEVAFAYNYDPYWASAPKLHVGDAAIFLLHRFAPQDAQARVHDAFTVPAVAGLLVLDPLDVQPLAARARVLALLKARR